MKLVSVIITCYNKQTTIRKCIDSVLDSTLKDIEVIVVNDASTDNSLLILQEYCNNITIINNEVNLGAGKSRQVGIKYATGEYVALIDGDDYVNPEYLEFAYNKATLEDLDLLITLPIIENENGLILKSPKLDCAFKNKYNIVNDLRFKFLACAIFKRSIFDEIDYSSLRCIEDTPTMFRMLYYVNRLAFTLYLGYHYIQKLDSLIHSMSLYKYYLYLILCWAEVYLFFKSKNQSCPMPYSVLEMAYTGWKLEEHLHKGQFTEELKLVKAFIKENVDTAIMDEKIKQLKKESKGKVK